jgi:hypothetical protein
MLETVFLDFVVACSVFLYIQVARILERPPIESPQPRVFVEPLLEEQTLGALIDAIDKKNKQPQNDSLRHFRWCPLHPHNLKEKSKEQTTSSHVCSEHIDVEDGHPKYRSEKE